MNREYHKWFSPSLQRYMELLIFGNNGTPVLIFPSLRGRFYEYEDREMISVLNEKIENEELQIFCVDSIDGESWNNFDAHPYERALRHTDYEKYILDEVLPFIQQCNPSEKLVLHGSDFGGYHAVNFSLRHPELVTSCIAFGGYYDIHQYVLGYFDDNCYYHCPFDFFTNLKDETVLSSIRERIRFILATGENDFALASNVQLSRTMESKNIPHWLDIWRDGTGHDWQWWKKMLEKYFSE